jgi:hypothetical protein
MITEVPAIEHIWHRLTDVPLNLDPHRYKDILMWEGEKTADNRIEPETEAAVLTTLK